MKCKLLTKVVAIGLSAALILSGGEISSNFRIADLSITARADSVKTITGLGTGAIGNPEVSANYGDEWKGSFVYYGKYDNSPVKYRVLDIASPDFGVTGGSLLLDCDSILFKAKFNSDRNAANSNDWYSCDLKGDLNGAKFLTSGSVFTEIEAGSIAASTKSSAIEGKDGEGLYKCNYTELTGEKIFILDSKELTRISYGYNTTNPACRRKNSSIGLTNCWLRSRSDVANCVGVNNDGHTAAVYVDGSSIGVSPAFNVSLSPIIFSSLIGSASGVGQPGAEYKLTLKDPDMSIEKRVGQNIIRVGDKVTVPYEITGNNKSNATQVSVLITDDVYAAGTSLTSGFNYQKLNVNSFGTSGEGAFTIPQSYASKTWGSDYHVYILAEDVNGEFETDYASELVELLASDSTTGSDDPYKGNDSNENQSGGNNGSSNGSSGTSDSAKNGKNIQDTSAQESAETVDKKQKSTSLSKLQAGNKKATISWKKVTAKGIKGYEIQYSTDKSFNSETTKKVTIKKTKTIKTTIKKLKPKTKYYVRIRTFSKKNGENVYSKWSKVKSVKVK